MVKLVKTGTIRAGTTGTSTTIENDGITISQSGSDFGNIIADTPFPSTSGKYVYEITIINETTISPYNIGVSFGITTSNTISASYIVCENYFSQSSVHWYNCFDNQAYDAAGSLITKEGDVVGVGWDLKNGKISFFINGKLVLYTDIGYFGKFAGATAIYPMVTFPSPYISTITAKVNFGQQKYTYSYEGFMNLYDHKIGGKEQSKLKLY